MQDRFHYVLLPTFVCLGENAISICNKKPIEKHFESPKLIVSPYPLKIKERELFQIAFEVDLLEEIPVGTTIDLHFLIGGHTPLPGYHYDNHTVINN